eukprot:9586704-Alexandrium_andersonii.AAC.1
MAFGLFLPDTCGFGSPEFRLELRRRPGQMLQCLHTRVGCHQMLIDPLRGPELAQTDDAVCVMNIGDKGGTSL